MLDSCQPVGPVVDSLRKLTDCAPLSGEYSGGYVTSSRLVVPFWTLGVSPPTCDSLSPCEPQWYVAGLSGCSVCWDLWGGDCVCYCSSPSAEDI